MKVQIRSFQLPVKISGRAAAANESLGIVVPLFHERALPRRLWPPWFAARLVKSVEILDYLVSTEP